MESEDCFLLPSVPIVVRDSVYRADSRFGTVCAVAPQKSAFALLVKKALALLVIPALSRNLYEVAIKNIEGSCPKGLFFGYISL